MLGRVPLQEEERLLALERKNVVVMVWDGFEEMVAVTVVQVGCQWLCPLLARMCCGWCGNIPAGAQGVWGKCGPVLHLGMPSPAPRLAPACASVSATPHLAQGPLSFGEGGNQPRTEARGMHGMVVKADLNFEISGNSNFILFDALVPLHHTHRGPRCAAKLCL